MADSDGRTKTHDGYRPITEGYQPGNVLKKGYTPTTTSDSNSAQRTPPRGGSSAMKPAQAGTPGSSKKN